MSEKEMNQELFENRLRSVAWDTPRDKCFETMYQCGLASANAQSRIRHRRRFTVAVACTSLAFIVGAVLGRHGMPIRSTHDPIALWE